MMSKIVIFLFAVLVASAVDASGTKDQLESLQNRVASYFATEIDRIEEKYNTTQPLLKENYGLIFVPSENSIYAKATDSVYAILSKAQVEASALIRQMQNTQGIEDCNEIGIYLSSMAEDFLKYMYRCDRAIYAAQTRITYMEAKYKPLHSGLIDRRNRFTACHQIVNDTEEVARAISCIEAIENETRTFVAEFVSPAFTQIDEVNAFLPAIKVNIARCSNRHASFQREAADETNRANMCYQKKIDEDKAAARAE